MTNDRKLEGICINPYQQFSHLRTYADIVKSYGEGERANVIANQMLAAEFGPMAYFRESPNDPATEMRTWAYDLPSLLARKRERTKDTPQKTVFQEDLAIDMLALATARFKDGFYTLDDFPARRTISYGGANVARNLDVILQAAAERNPGGPLRIDMMRHPEAFDIVEEAQILHFPFSTRPLPPVRGSENKL
jgi:hypothetical protein